MIFNDKLFLRLLSFGLAASAAAATPAFAQATASFAAGARVSDTAGGEVGTIAREDGDYVILKTDKHEVRLPKTSFTAHQGGFIMAMTRDQVNAAVEQSLAQADATIVAGATVSGSQGGTVGTIDAVDGDLVTLKLASGTLVRLPRAALAPAPSGAVIAMTVAELEAAAQAAAAPAEAQAATE